ncbi:MAG: site-specific integrase [Bdellovibrionales bacterium]|nr:site-specific integrase [Bdellovibrionales bacterium]
MAIIKRYIKKNGQKKVCYQAQVYVKGFRLKCKTFKNKTEAYVWHDKQKEQFLKNPSEFYQEKESIFFSECFKQYVEEAFPLLKPATKQAYEARFRYFTKGPLSTINMEYLNAKYIHTWINWLKKHHTAKNKRRKTFRHELQLLSAILNWYRNFVDEDFNIPITKQHRQLCHYKPVPPQRPDYYARPEELRDWIKWLKEHRSNPIYWQLATFMVLTGARVGEACGMCWDSIDLKYKQARVIQRMGWDHNTKKPYLEETTKTSASVRVLLLSSELISVLREMKEESENEMALLFTDKQGEALRYNAIQSAFNAGFKALGLPWRSTHILRHSYATGALIATKDISSVQASLGHTSSRMTEKYAKVIALLNNGVAEKTAKFFDIFNKQKVSE